MGLAEAGAAIYATGRTVSAEAFGADSGVIPLRCDHTDDRQVEEAFRRVAAERGRLDALVNNVWAATRAWSRGGAHLGETPLGAAVAALGRDVRGRRPRPLTLEDV